MVHRIPLPGSVPPSSSASQLLSFSREMSYSGKKGTAEPQTGKRVPSAKASTKPSFLSIPADIDKDPVALMQLASKLSLDSGNFVDTKFYAFSRRNTSGAIYAPKAIYANSWMLRAKSPQYFENRMSYLPHAVPVSLKSNIYMQCSSEAMMPTVPSAL